MKTESSKLDIEAFLAEPKIALAGVSRSGKKFGNHAARMLLEKGYEVLPIHPEANELEGQKCYSSVSELPTDVKAALLVVPPRETEKLIPELSARGIEKIWMQQGAESAEAIEMCNKLGLRAVGGECVFMFTEPVGGGHAFHRWIWKVLGKLPD